jgi:tRNA(Ile2) C34 agmatinyltransferase TiaS
MATYEQNCKTLSRIENSLLSPPDDDPGCPDCGAEVLPDDDGGYMCSECDWYWYPDHEMEDYYAN